MGLEDAAARREAAERLIANSDAIVRFTLRAVGQLGPAVGSPLSNPNAQPDLRFVPQVPLHTGGGEALLNPQA